MGFPGGSYDKESVYNAGDLGSILESGRSLGEGNGYPFQYSYLENSIDRGAWWVTKESDDLATKTTTITTSICIYTPVPD